MDSKQLLEMPDQIQTSALAYMLCGAHGKERAVDPDTFVRGCALAHLGRQQKVAAENPAMLAKAGGGIFVSKIETDLVVVDEFVTGGRRFLLMTLAEFNVYGEYMENYLHGQGIDYPVRSLIDMEGNEGKVDFANPNVS